MDIKMPVMNGIDATLAIKALISDIPIVALTAYALSGDREKCFAAGCNEYLSKPITKAELMRVLANYLV
jgi:CheY-like chemotaxis protein